MLKWIDSRLISGRDFMKYPYFKQTQYNDLFQQQRWRRYNQIGIPNVPVALNKNL